ncbi:hypothetical protein Tco_0571241 [Tanacetum coccineum]
MGYSATCSVRVDRLLICVGIICAGYGTRFLESEGEWGRRGVKEKQHGSATVASPTSSQYGGLKKRNTVTSESTGQVAEVTAAPSGTPDASTTLVNPGTPHEVVHESVMKEIFASYANKLSPTSSYARILIEIDACNGFSDNLVMAVPSLAGPGYTKETIRVEYDHKTASSIGKKNVSTPGNSSKKTSMTNASTSSEDEVEPVDNKMANFMAPNSLGVEYGTKSLLEQYKETYGNVEYDYDPYDDDLYEG